MTAKGPVQTVTSAQVAEALDKDPTQIRKDFGLIGLQGMGRVGFDVCEVCRAVRVAVGFDQGDGECVGGQCVARRPSGMSRFGATGAIRSRRGIPRHGAGFRGLLPCCEGIDHRTKDARDTGMVSYDNSSPYREFGTPIADNRGNLSLAGLIVGQVTRTIVGGRIWGSDALLAGSEYCRIILVHGRRSGSLAARARLGLPLPERRRLL